MIQSDRGSTSGTDYTMICATASQHEKLKAASKDLVFIQRGFSNWKDATEGFR